MSKLEHQYTIQQYEIHHLLILNSEKNALEASQRLIAMFFPKKHVLLLIIIFAVHY